jgi:hypothetical protein
MPKNRRKYPSMSMQQVYNPALFDPAGIANEREKDREQEAKKDSGHQEEGGTGEVG